MGSDIEGKAVSIWYGDGVNIGYHFYLGGGVYEIGRSGNPEVTMVIEFFLPTGKSGIPKTPFTAEGKYISRTTSNPDLEIPGDTNIELTEGEIEENIEHAINKIIFKFKHDFKGRPSDATVTFARPRPEG